MRHIVTNKADWAKAGLAALGLAAVAIPAGGALASAEEPAAAAPLSAEQVDQARTIFADWSCGACHTLEDAGGSGHIGPAFDGNAGLSHDFIVERVTNGQGAMPGFGGQLTDEEIDLLGNYIVQVKK